MNKMTYILQAFTILAVLVFSSCEHKELCDNHSNTAKLHVVFDWQHAPDAQPETMRLYLFPLDGGKAQPYEFPDYRGGYINVPAGRYRALCVNSDTESVLYRNIDLFDSFEAYAPDGVLKAGFPRAKDASDERIAKSPDRLYSDRLEDLAIEISKEEQTVTLYPALSVCRYRVEIRNVSNLEHHSSERLSGSLSGLSGGLQVGRNELTSDLVTVPFNVVSDGVSTLTAEFLAFGQAGMEGKPAHKLVIYLALPDGSKESYSFDVSNQVDEAADPRDVYILLDGLSLPKPIDDGGGFHIHVDDWKDENIDIEM